MSAPNEPILPASPQLDLDLSAPPEPASKSESAEATLSEDEEDTDEETPEEAGAATALPDEALEAIMSPEASPWRSQKMNRRPLIVAGVVVVGVCALMAYAMLERYADSATDNPLRAASSDEPVLPRGTDSRRMAEDIIGQPHIGLIPDAVQAAPTPPAEPAPEAKVPITSVVDEPSRPILVAQTDPPQPKASQEEEQWHQARVSALREALIAPRTIRFDHRPAEPSQADFVQRELARVAQERAALGGAVDPMAAYQQAAAQAAQLLGAQPSAAHALPMAGMPSATPSAMPGGMPFAGVGPSAGPPPSSNARNDLRAYEASGNSDRWMLPNQVESAVSPYMLLPGDVIPSVLDSAINSELPGPITGHVAQPVYSATGRHELLAPAGTKLYGQYSADVVFGQNRLLVAWQLLRFPNGSTLDIGAMPGTDGVGRAGFEDQVDNHYFRLFSSALLLSLVTTGVTMAQGPSSSGPDRMSVGGAMSQALGLQFGQVTAQLLQKNLNVAPTLDIRPGYRFNIVVTKKVVFPGPYRE